jgi:hypothetical protein
MAHLGPNTYIQFSSLVRGQSVVRRKWRCLAIARAAFES